MKRHIRIGNYVNNKPIFCSLVFGSASINSYGEYIPCCSIRPSEWEYYKDTDPSIIANLDPKDRINAPNLREIRKTLLAGDWPKACENCKNAEAAGIHSMRTIWNQGLSHHDIPMEEYVDPSSIKYLDLTFSTKCNSKCMTCNSDLSDFWEAEDKFIWGTPDPNKKRICVSDTEAEKLAKQFPNVERINFVGGEPTISEEHVNFLHSLVELGRSKNISIGYVTNLAAINTDLFELWSKFKEVGGSLSIDGYGKVNEYIRYPVKWEKTEANLRKYFNLMTPNNMSFGLSCTVSLFNAIQCFDLLEYWIDLVTEHKMNPHVGIFINRVSHPNFLTIDMLSLEYRQIGIDRAKQLLEKINNYNEANEQQINIGSKQSVELLINWLLEPQVHDLQKLKKCKHFITQSDKFRKRHLKDYIPELWEELEKLWNSQT
jgi:pyruvate-formate lyase-activating enzyme